MDGANRNQSRSSSDELLKAQAHIWNNIFNFIKSMSLKCAIQLGIPDAVHRHGGPITIPELAAALPSIHPKKSHSCLSRLMRILVHSGFFANTAEKEEEKAYLLTPASHLLLKDSPVSLTPFLLAMLDPILIEPWQLLSAWFQNSDTTPFETLNGRTFWDQAGAEPRLNRFFNEAMACDGQLVMRKVLEECKGVFEGLRTLVDVGGGTGTVAKAIAAAFPKVKCTVLDLPHVIHGLQGSRNLQFLGGDMFQAIPTANAVLLKSTLHDWSDEDCIKILKLCKAAIPGREEGGKLIIIDMVMDHYDPKGEDYHHESVETQLFFDMLMMTLASGRERNEKEWANLFSDAGFNDYKITQVLGLRALIEVYP